MTEILLLARLRNEVPLRQPSARAERSLMAAISGDSVSLAPTSRAAWSGLVRPGRLAPRRLAPCRLALAGGLGLALAAGLLLAQVISSGGIAPTPSASAASLARRAAAAVSRERAYPIGQWFFVQQDFRGPVGSCLPGQLSMSQVLPIAVSSLDPYPAPSSSGPYPTPSSSGPHPSASSSSPYPAPSSSGSYPSASSSGPYPSASSSGPYASRSEQPQSCASATFSAGTITFWSRNDPALRSFVDDFWLRGRHQRTTRYDWAGRPITHADLSRLPASPRSLIRYLSGLSSSAFILPLVTGPYSGSAIGLNTLLRANPSKRAFAAIGQILDTHFVKPALLAELYRALGDLPGVTVNPRAIDIAGRHGVAFTMPLLGGVRLQIVLDSHDYQFMGYSVEDLSGPAAWGNAVLRLVPVAAPGNRPNR